MRQEQIGSSNNSISIGINYKGMKQERRRNKSKSIFAAERILVTSGIATTQSSTPSRTTGLRNYLAGILLNNKWFTRHVLLDRWFLLSHQDSLYAARD
jgi:hypothetical protein